LRLKYEKSESEPDSGGIEDDTSEGDDVAEGVPGGEGKEEEAVNDGVEMGDAWSSSDDGSKLEAGGSVGRSGRNRNLSCNRFVGDAGDCGLIGDWATPPCPPVD